MKSIFKLLALLLLSLASVSSNAAVTCIQNKTTGVYENKSGNAADCDFKRLEDSHANNPASTLSSVATIDLTAGSSVALAPVKSPFKALVSDINVRSVLNRWSREVGMQDVIWQNGEDIPVDRHTDFSSDFGQAVFDLMATTGFTKQAARACHHSNGVLRVIPRTKFCDQP